MSHMKAQLGDVPYNQFMEEAASHASLLKNTWDEVGREVSPSPLLEHAITDIDELADIVDELVALAE